ncbi:hypothetical protein HHI36_024057 [Cryptolaemus montrouzieri]|uniref:Uncharacterized protein n=1 Tax=Cryptolaemus montrouzieri TaxID=559131 RepID=A0ABD2N7V8_9CUCU
MNLLFADLKKIRRNVIKLERSGQSLTYPPLSLNCDDEFNIILNEIEEVIGVIDQFNDDIKRVCTESTLHTQERSILDASLLIIRVDSDDDLSYDGSDEEVEGAIGNSTPKPAGVNEGESSTSFQVKSVPV